MKYNILWADDDIATLCDDNVRVLFERNNIVLLGTFENSDSLKTFIDETNERIDAIVVDANFPYKQFTSNKEKDTLGLQKIAQWAEWYESKFACIVYTGRRDLVDTEEGKMQFEYFIKNHLIVNKNPESGIENLISKVKELVERRNSVEWVIGNQYYSELETAAVFDNESSAKTKKLFLEILTKNHNNTLCDTERYFNSIRCDVLDNMNTLAAKHGIVPEGLSLNDFSRFLCKDTKLQYCYSKDEVLPDALKEVVRYVVRMTQDASHDSKELALHLRKYINKTENTILIRSLCYAAIELMEWFMQYVKDHPDVDYNIKNWCKK